MSLHTYTQAITTIVFSKQPVMVVLRILLALLIGGVAVASFLVSSRSLWPPEVYQKDLLQEYVMARAVLAGISPYLPLPELAGRFLGPLPATVLPHASPHPPFVALLSLPLALHSYQAAAVVWFGFEALLIGLSVYVLLRCLVPQPKGIHYVGAATLVLLFTPFKDELMVGQLMSLMMALLIMAWLLLRDGKDIRGGVVLGLVFSIKLFAWPVILYLLLKKRWKAMMAFGLTALMAHLITAAWIGFGQVYDYYLKIGPSVAPLYQAHERNFSIWTIGYRIFSGTGSPVIAGIEAPALVEVPALAVPLSFTLCLFLLAASLLLAYRASNFDTAFAILISISLLVNPVAWSHYLILAVLPIAILIKELVQSDPQRLNMKGIFAVGTAIWISVPLRGILFIFSGTSPLIGRSVEVPFLASLLTLAPALAVLGLIWALWHIDSASQGKPG
jgi:hypothetical protein